MTSPPSSPPLPTITRKRSRVDYLAYDCPSSDPVFSSDDFQDASVEQYDVPRKKKHFRGSWWQSSQSSTEPKSSAIRVKGQLERNVDSGVWMGSDDSEQSASSLPDFPDTHAHGGFENLMQHTTANEGFVARNGRNDEQSALITNDELHRQKAIRAAQSTIQACCDENRFEVDLSTLNIGRLPENLLRPLNSIVAIPRHLDSANAPKPMVYQELTGHLKIFLSRMHLTELPPELWELTRVDTLSVHSNRLTRISPAIAKLKSLSHLQLQHNSLNWLPWELIELYHIHQSMLANPIVFGNPLLVSKNVELCHYPWTYRLHSSQHRDHSYEENHSLSETENAIERKMYEWKAHLDTILDMKPFDLGTTRLPIFIASTRIVRLRSDGTSNSTLIPPSQRSPFDNLSAANIPSTSSAQDLRHVPSHCPSLMELSLAAVSRHCTSSFVLNSYGEDLPVGVQQVISKHMQEAEEDGSRECSVCKKAYIIPRAEWMEYWWFVAGSSAPMTELFLPYLRRACSWACAETVEAGFRTGINTLDLGQGLGRSSCS